MANRTKLTPKKRAAFLKMVAETANITASAMHVHVTRQRLYEIRAKNRRFREEWDAAVELGTRALEDEATRRATVGWDEPVFYQGNQCGLVRKFSDTLLIFQLKARDPAKYRERIDANLVHSGNPDAPIKIDASLTADEAARKYLALVGG